MELSFPALKWIQNGNLRITHQIILYLINLGQSRKSSVCGCEILQLGSRLIWERGCNFLAISFPHAASTETAETHVVLLVFDVAAENEEESAAAPTHARRRLRRLPPQLTSRFCKHFPYLETIHRSARREEVGK